MKSHILQQHFEQYGFSGMQADAPSLVFEQYREEMATKHDLVVLRAELKGDMASLRGELRGDMASLRAELKGEMSSLRSEIKGDMKSLRSELTGEMASLGSKLEGSMQTLKADLTWRFVGLIAFFGTVMTIVGLFVG